MRSRRHQRRAWFHDVPVEGHHPVMSQRGASGTIDLGAQKSGGGAPYHLAWVRATMTMFGSTSHCISAAGTVAPVVGSITSEHV